MDPPKLKPPYPPLSAAMPPLAVQTVPVDPSSNHPTPQLHAQSQSPLQTHLQLQSQSQSQSQSLAQAQVVQVAQAAQAGLAAAQQAAQAVHGGAAAQAGPRPVIKRRAPIACRRCRRMRSKCLHQSSKPPCQACRDAGIGPADCIFPVRGQPDNDREYRHPRMRSDKQNRRDQTKVRRDNMEAPVGSPVSSVGLKMPRVDDWDRLPPLPEIIDAVNKFTRHYFQLGFIPKQQFPERLRTNHRSVSPFFLLGILSISARLTPSLVERHGSAVQAAETYMDHASTVALTELYQEPSLERCQAFYLLSIAQQGSGMRHRSSINMAIAMRMATLMQLHREETYELKNPTPELVIMAESARRTLWMLHSQDNLHSGPRSPVSLSESDITALLPSNEIDFATAREPRSRAALEGTPPALKNPELVADEGRSLFATLIQAHYYWGGISRRAVNHDKSPRPWEEGSEYAKIKTKLVDWEKGLPNDHRWSNLLLKGYKQEGQDLAYLGVTMITKLCNIVIRKAYLHEIMTDDKSDPRRTEFWRKMSRDLFMNVKELYEQIDTQYADRGPEEGMGAQMAAFCVYTCGFLACYLCKYANICPEPSIARDGPMMVHRILKILSESKDIWPLASRWHDHLERFYHSQKGMVPSGDEHTMADSREPIPHVFYSAVATQSGQSRGAPLSPEARHAIPPPQSPGTPLLPAPQLNGTSAMYNIDPNLRLPAPQQSQGGQITSGPQLPLPSQQQGMPPGPPPPQSPVPAQQHPQQAVMSAGRQQPDGLGLLLEAFDTQTGGGVAPTTTGGPGGAPGQGPSSAAAYDPQAPPAPQEYYPQTGLAMNDGYENELGYYMSDGVPVMGTWSGVGNSMYTYLGGS